VGTGEAQPRDAEAAFSPARERRGSSDVRRAPITSSGARDVAGAWIRRHPLIGAALAVARAKCRQPKLMASNPSHGCPRTLINTGSRRNNR
jgi:hypothetical protein